jgi:hypothetical protein
MARQSLGKIGALFMALAYPLAADPLDLLKTDLSMALGEAASTGRHLHIAFIGEGWSMTSNRFMETVLQSETFIAFAEAHLVQTEVRSRRKPKLTKAETARLQSLVIHFDIKSWPTVILIGPDGTEVLRHGYKDLSGEAYAATLQNLVGPAPEQSPNSDQTRLMK